MLFSQAYLMHIPDGELAGSNRQGHECCNLDVPEQLPLLKLLIKALTDGELMLPCPFLFTYLGLTVRFGLSQSGSLSYLIN